MNFDRKSSRQPNSNRSVTELELQQHMSKRQTFDRLNPVLFSRVLYIVEFISRQDERTQEAFLEYLREGIRAIEENRFSRESETEESRKRTRKH